MLNFPNPKKIDSSKISIIDSQVFDENDKNVALSKSQFAEHILEQSDNFNNFDFCEFKKIFEVISDIIRD